MPGSNTAPVLPLPLPAVSATAVPTTANGYIFENVRPPFLKDTTRSEIVLYLAQHEKYIKTIDQANCTRPAHDQMVPRPIITTFDTDLATLLKRFDWKAKTDAMLTDTFILQWLNDQIKVPQEASINVVQLIHTNCRMNMSIADARHRVRDLFMQVDKLLKEYGKDAFYHFDPAGQKKYIKMILPCIQPAIIRSNLAARMEEDETLRREPDVFYTAVCDMASLQQSFRTTRLSRPVQSTSATSIPNAGW
jgi:hypothetical protein